MYCTGLVQCYEYLSTGNTKVIIMYTVRIRRLQSIAIANINARNIYFRNIYILNICTIIRVIITKRTRYRIQDTGYRIQDRQELETKNICVRASTWQYYISILKVR